MLLITAFVRKAGKIFALLVIALLFTVNTFAQRIRADFDKGWHFHLGDTTDAQQTAFADANWRVLNLPHDWSIEGAHSARNNKATPEGGALPGGIGWYRKTFMVLCIIKRQTGLY